MDANVLKLFDILLKYNGNDLNSADSVSGFTKELYSLGYDYGIYACMYLFSRQEKIFDNEGIRKDVTNTFLKKLYAANKNKTVKVILQTPLLIKGFYTLGEPFEGAAIEILTDLLCSGKTAQADAVLKALYKNTYGEYNKGMVTVFEMYIQKLKEKQNKMVPVLEKKTVKLLTEHIEKIKGPEKPLLLQRIKEMT